MTILTGDDSRVGARATVRVVCAHPPFNPWSMVTADIDVPELTVAEAAGWAIIDRLDPAVHQQLMNYLDNNEGHD